jgi:ubiquitin C-terminal hydrolase
VVATRGLWAPRFNNRRQQDASDLFVRLMVACNECDLASFHALMQSDAFGPHVHFTTPYWTSAGIRGVSETKCGLCLKEVHDHWILDHLSLALPRHQPVSIEDCFREYFADELLSGLGDRCLRCGGGLCRAKTARVIKWPSVLVVHLKRWLSTDTPGVYAKERRRVDFETLLRDLPGYGGSPYHLRAVLQHHGDAGAGHYTCYVRLQDNRWYFCDDFAPPRPVEVEQVLSAEAMMLFYDQ